MAKKAFTALTELVSIADDDILVVHDISAGADRKITKANLVGGGISRGYVTDLALVGSSNTVDNNWLGLPSGWTSCLIRINKWGTLNHQATSLLKRLSPYGSGLAECMNIGADDPWLNASGHWPLVHLTNQEVWYNTSTLQWKMIPLSTGLNFKNITNSGNVTVSFSYLAW